MDKVRIITDVTAHLEPALIDQYQITVLPIEIRFGDKKFHIGPNQDTEELFQQMADSPARSMQATISTNAFQEVFARLSRETNEILVILNSSKLSKGYARARSATRLFLGRCRITVLDSLTASWGLGLMVKAAAQAAEEGQPLDDIVRLVRGLLPHIYLVFFVERLDYLERGGRIGPAQALLGTMLRIKPVLFIEDGDIIPLEKVRTRMMAIAKLADFVTEFAHIQQVVVLSSPLNGDINQLIGDLKEQLSLALPNQKFPVIAYDPVLACHLGPEALGVVVYEGLLD
jgi:DegV family protein with EDD domain